MQPIIQKTFGGLTKEYYVRHFIFGLIFTGFFVFMQITNPKELSEAIPLFLIVAINTFLYPYARYVYESVIGFIMGDNLFITAALPAMMFKLIMMALCWALAIFIAPLGLAYLYFYHTKQEKNAAE